MPVNNVSKYNNVSFTTNLRRDTSSSDNIRRDKILRHIKTIIKEKIRYNWNDLERKYSVEQALFIVNLIQDTINNDNRKHFSNQERDQYNQIQQNPLSKFILEKLESDIAYLAAHKDYNYFNIINKIYKTFTNNIKCTDHIIELKEFMINLGLFIAFKYSDKSMVEQLIRKEANINFQDEDGKTPLSLACAAGDNTEIVKLLIDRGANIHVQDDHGRAPLHIAASGSNLEMFKLLIEHKANVDVINKDGRTPLHIASNNKDLDMVKLLIKYRANINVKDKDGRTSLHIASGIHNLGIDIVDLLIKHGDNIHVKDNNGRTPLHIASGNDNLDMIKLLIKHGADVNVIDKHGQTPLTIAAYRDKLIIIHLLIEYGADINVLDENVKTIYGVG